MQQLFGMEYLFPTWKIENKDIWDKDIWQKIALVDITTFIIHVPVHHKYSEGTKFNDQVDKLTRKTNEARMPKIYLKKYNDSWIRKKQIKNIIIHKQEVQWNIKPEPTDMPIDSNTTWAHHQTGHASIHITGTWLKTRNTHIPSKYIQFQIRIYKHCQNFKA